MISKARVTIHPDYRVGSVDRRLFSAFLEPIGNWVDGGIWNDVYKRQLLEYSFSSVN